MIKILNAKYCTQVAKKNTKVLQEIITEMLLVLYINLCVFLVYDVTNRKTFENI